MAKDKVKCTGAGGPDCGECIEAMPHEYDSPECRLGRCYRTKRKVRCVAVKPKPKEGKDGKG
jgi:hypothetical protein